MWQTERWQEICKCWKVIKAPHSGILTTITAEEQETAVAGTAPAYIIWKCGMNIEHNMAHRL